MFVRFTRPESQRVVAIVKANSQPFQQLESENARKGRPLPAFDSGVLKRNYQKGLAHKRDPADLRAIHFRELNGQCSTARSAGGPGACGMQSQQCRGFGSKNGVASGVQDKGERSLPIQSGFERHVSIHLDWNPGFSARNRCVIGRAGRLKCLITNRRVDVVIGNVKNVQVAGPVIRGYLVRQTHAMQGSIVGVDCGFDGGRHGSNCSREKPGHAVEPELDGLTMRGR